MVRPVGAAAPEPSSVTLVPTVGLTVGADKGIVGNGDARNATAAATAPLASSIPAPQVLVVQMHSLFCAVELGARHTGGAGVVVLVVGNVRTEDCNAVRIWLIVSAGLTESIRPTVLATKGDEKLVPSDVLKLSL